MTRRKMGEGGTFRVLFGRDPIGSPAGGGRCGLTALAVLAGTAGVLVAAGRLVVEVL